MPIVSGGGGVSIPFDGDSSKLIAASNEVIKSLDAVKAKVKANASELDAAAKKEQAAIQKTAAQYSGSLVPGLQKAGDAVGKFVSANSVLLAGLAAVGAGTMKAYQAYQKYAGAVRDGAIAAGTSAKEYSTLLQVLDDFQVSAEDVTAATKAMKEKGMVPTLETLAQLADQFNAIKDPAERLQFAQDNLGKSYSKYLNVLSQGGDVLRRSAEEVNKNLILTDEQIKKAEQARLAVDAWADAWEGFKVSTGSAVGGLIVLNKQIVDYTEMTGKAVGAAGVWTDEFKAFQAQMKQGAAATEYWTARMGEAESQTEENTEALKELSSANAAIISDAISIQRSNDEYVASQDEILAKIGELKAEKEKLYPWEREKIADINDAIGEQEQAYADGAKEFAKAQTEKLAMMALEKIALLDGVAGFSDAEFAKAQALLDTAGVAEDSAMREALAFEYAAEQIANAIDPAMQLEDVLRTMSQGYKINVAVNYQSSGNAPQNAAFAPAEFTDTVGPTTPGTSSNPQFGNAKAAGGYLSSGWNLVGDRPGGGFVPGVSELIHGNKVYSSSQSAALLKSGRVKIAKSYAVPEDDVWTVPPVTTGGGGSSSSFTTTSAVKNKGFFGSGDAVSAVENSVVEMQTSTEQAIASMQVQVQTAMQQVSSMVGAGNTILERIESILQNEHPLKSAKLFGQELAKAS